MTQTITTTIDRHSTSSTSHSPIISRENLADFIKNHPYRQDLEYLDRDRLLVRPTLHPCKSNVMPEKMADSWLVTELDKRALSNSKPALTVAQLRTRWKDTKGTNKESSHGGCPRSHDPRISDHSLTLRSSTGECCILIDIKLCKF